MTEPELENNYTPDDETVLPEKESLLTPIPRVKLIVSGIIVLACILLSIITSDIWILLIGIAIALVVGVNIIVNRRYNSKILSGGFDPSVKPDRGSVDVSPDSGIDSVEE